MRYVFGFLLLFSACRGTAPVASNRSGDGPDTDIIYRHPTISPRDYKKFLVEPVAIELKKAEKNPFTSEELAALSEAFRQAAIQTIEEKGYAVVGTPQAGALRLTVQIAELETPHLIPTGAGDVQVKFDAGKRAATMTLRCEDAETGQPVMTLVHVLRGAKYGFGTKEKRVSNMLDAFRGWGHALLMRLNEERR